MDTQKKHNLSGTIILVSCFLLPAGACDNSDRIETETQANGVLLNFNASTIDATTTETRSFVPIESFAKNEYIFGMSVTKDNASRGEIFEGSRNLKATMSRPSGDAPWNWEFSNNASGTVVTPRGPEGKPLRVIAYYPAIAGTENFTDGIPFDFTQTNNPQQKEILYNTNTSYTIPSSGGSDKVTIPLKFQHAYSWISIKVTKSVDKGSHKLSGVSIDNLSGGWIKNKGKINPATGMAMQGAIQGPIGEVRTAEVLDPSGDTATPIIYDLLVPAFMDRNVKDDDLVFTLIIDGKKEIFSLGREHLNNDGDTYGFKQGYANTYNVEFNNSSLNMRLLNWTSTRIDGDFGQNVTNPTNYQEMSFYYAEDNSGWTTANGKVFPPKYKDLPAGDRRYYNYFTTVKYGGNGEYVPAKPVTDPPPPKGIIIEDDANVATQEPACRLFQMTTKDVSIEPVPWEDEMGQLVAKELCRKYNGGGFKDWRLPRASELRALLVYAIYGAGTKQFINLKLTNDVNREKLYWTGTEESEDKAWAMLYYDDNTLVGRGPNISAQDKSTRLSVRCIRQLQ